MYFVNIKLKNSRIFPLHKKEPTQIGSVNMNANYSITGYFLHIASTLAMTSSLCSA